MRRRYRLARGIGAAVSLLALLVNFSTKCLAEASIAFSQEPGGGWRFGTAYNYETVYEAEETALKHCSKSGTRCTSISQFNNACAALAVQRSNNGWSVSTNVNAAQAEKKALKRCQTMGLRCKIVTSFCDSVKEIVKTVICTRPVFREEHKLKIELMETPEASDRISAAIVYLRQKYCREIEGALSSDNEEHVGDNCFQYSTVFRGERVYWGRCWE